MTEEIEQDQVRPSVPDQLDPGGSIRGLADELDVAFGSQAHAQCMAQQRIAIDYCNCKRRE